MEKSSDFGHWIIDGDPNTGAQGVSDQRGPWIVHNLHIRYSYNDFHLDQLENDLFEFFWGDYHLLLPGYLFLINCWPR